MLSIKVVRAAVAVFLMVSAGPQYTNGLKLSMLESRSDRLAMVAMVAPAPAPAEAAASDGVALCGTRKQVKVKNASIAQLSVKDRLKTINQSINQSIMDQHPKQNRSIHGSTPKNKKYLGFDKKDDSILWCFMCFYLCVKCYDFTRFLVRTGCERHNTVDHSLSA